jgi:hypothetical protein
MASTAAPRLEPGGPDLALWHTAAPIWSVSRAELVRLASNWWRISRGARYRSTGAAKSQCAGAGTGAGRSAGTGSGRGRAVIASVCRQANS